MLIIRGKLGWNQGLVSDGRTKGGGNPSKPVARVSEAHPGQFLSDTDPRMRALRLSVYGPALDCNTDEVDCGKLAASVYPASYLGVSSRALMEIRSTHRAHRAIGLQAAFG